MPPPFAHLEETPETQIGAAFSCFRLPAAAGAVRVVLVGELDLVTAASARAAIRSAQDETRALTCDLGDVWFVDLAGLRVLLDAAARAQLTGGRLTVTNCPAIVPRMLQLLGLRDALEIEAPRRPVAQSALSCAQIRRHVS